MNNQANKPNSDFDELGLNETIGLLLQECQELYLEDNSPWIVGYSGGKDSTAILQLVWLAVAGLPPEQRTKTVHVINTDTLVENPVVAGWVDKSLESMKNKAKANNLPITPHKLTPEIADSFWVNLLGKGYPAPRNKFRWCTYRLKIKPSNTFITELIQKHGPSILVLGTRKAESSRRASVMKRHEKKRVRDRLSPNASLPSSQVYTPIENWSNDDVWLFLMRYDNPWGYDNHQLLNMYKGASADGECPLVVDTSTPSCGSSRFGCWVCTLVDKDRSMEAMILNDGQKDWMMPLLELRDSLALRDDRHLRDFRRLHGNVQLFNGRAIHGPYRKDVREDILRRVLEAQMFAQENAPPDLGELSIITMDELREIRRIWVVEKHEMEDSLPRLYEEITGKEFPLPRLDDSQVFGCDEMEVLKDVTEGDLLHFELIRELLHVEWDFRSKVRRAGLFERLEDAFRRGFYEDEDDATEREQRRQDALQDAREGKYLQQPVTEKA